MVFEKKPTFKGLFCFFKWSQCLGFVVFFPFQMGQYVFYPPWICVSQKQKKRWNVHDLLDVLNNLTKFQIQDKNKQISVKTVNTPVTFKCSQGHWNWHEHLEHSEYTIMWNLTFITFIASKNCNLKQVKVFAMLTITRPAGWPAQHSSLHTLIMCVKKHSI